MYANGTTEGKLNKNMFSLFLKGGENDFDSEIRFGGVNKTLF
jgi:hypothetical protein